MKRVVKVILWTVLLASVFFGILAYAQTKTQENGIVSPRRQAEIDYDTAKNFYMAGRYEEAAVYFVKADNLLPSEIALIQAFRAYHRADKRLKAQEVALVYMYRYSGKQLPNSKIYEDVVCMQYDELEALKGRSTRDVEIFDDMLKNVSNVDGSILRRRLVRNVAVIDILLKGRSITDIPANPF